MKKLLSIDDNGQGLEAILKLLRDHGFSASEVFDEPFGSSDTLRQSEQRYRDILESAPVGIFSATLDGKFLSVNPAVARMLKYDSPEEMIRLVNRTNIADAVYVTSARRQEVIESVLQHKDWQIFEERFRCKDGSIVTCNFHYRAVPGQGGNPQEFEGFIEDITARKGAEEALRESESRYRQIVETAEEGVWQVDREWRTIYVNQRMEQMLGCEPGAMLGLHLCDFMDDEGRQALTGLITRREQGIREIHDFRFIRRDGSGLDVLVSASPLFDGCGRFTGAIALVTDISDRKRAEDELRQSNDLLRAIIEAVPTAIIGLDLDGNVRNVWNPAAEKMLGWSAREVMGRPLPSVPVESSEEFRRFREWIRSGKTMNGVDVIRKRRDGTPIEYSIYASPLHDAEGRIIGNIAVLVDISERKRTDTALRMSKFIIDHASIGIMRGNGDARILSVNEYWARVLGYTVEELCSMSFFDIDPNLTEESWREHRKKLTATGSNTIESLHRRKDGTLFPVEVTINYLKFGDQVFSCSFTKDISKRKEIEEKLQQANLIVENSPAVLFRWRATEGWPVEMVSGNIAQFGYSPEELLSEEFSFSSMVYHEDLERVASEVQAYTCRGEDRFQQEYRIITKDGVVRWIDDRTVVERDADGRITHYQGILVDITDRKRTEAVLAARMRLLQFAETHTVDELLEATLNELEELTGSCIGFYHFLEADQHTLRLQNWSTRTRNDFCTAAGKGLHYDVTAAGVWVDCIHQRRPVIHNDYASLPHRKGMPPGHPSVIRELVVPVFRGESIVAILGVGNKPWNYSAVDVETVSMLADLSWGIVERKRAEEALRVSERKYRSIIEHAPFGISRSTREGKLLSVNPAFARILKYDSPEEMLETVNRSTIQDVLFAEPSRRAPIVDRIFEGDTWCVFENRYRCKDGTVITGMVHSRKILGQKGKESEFESFLENITDRVETEKALRESEEKFRVLAETAPAAIAVYQGDTFVYVNPAATLLFGYSAAELLEKNFWEWADLESREIIKERGLARQRGEQVLHQYEHRFVTKNGEVGWAMVSAGSIQYRGKPAGIATFIDITETKRTEEQLKASLAEKVVLLKEVHHRVKNNLQIISSLLDLQSDSIKEEDSRRYISESQDRIRSMALVHEQLYRSEDLSLINFACYVDDLVKSFSCSSVGNKDRIHTDVEVQDIELGIDEAIPCGLIVNELVSNAFKHAFPGNRMGTVLVRGTLNEEGYVCLTVADNGIGLPKGFDISASESLGLQIVNLLTKQLHGTLEMRGDHGMTVTVRFKSERG